MDDLRLWRDTVRWFAYEIYDLSPIIYQSIKPAAQILENIISLYRSIVHPPVAALLSAIDLEVNPYFIDLVLILMISIFGHGKALLMISSGRAKLWGRARQYLRNRGVGFFYSIELGRFPFLNARNSYTDRQKKSYERMLESMEKHGVSVSGLLEYVDSNDVYDSEFLVHIQNRDRGMILFHFTTILYFVLMAMLVLNHIYVATDDRGLSTALPVGSE